MKPSRENDRAFDLMLACPDAYGAKAKGIDRALAAGLPRAQAALLCGLTNDEYAATLGFTKRLKRGVRRAGRGARRGMQAATRASPAALAARGVRAAGRGIGAALASARRRIFRAFFGKLVSRRARLLSYQRRRSLQPDRSELYAAGRWARAYIRRRGRFGRLVAAALAGEVGAEPATSAVLTASIPVLLNLARRALKQAEGEGAPANPRTSGVPGSPGLDPGSAFSVTPAAEEE
jgi:hypothetical protein